jgi:hypothetical protein
VHRFVKRGVLFVATAATLIALTLSIARRAAALSCATRELESLTLEIESATLDGKPTDVPDWRRRGQLTAWQLILSADDRRTGVYVTLRDAGSP